MPVLLKSLLSVLPFFWFLALLALILLFRKKQRFGKTMVLLALLWLLMTSTGPLPHRLIRSLEKRYEVFTGPLSLQEGERLHILVLGGGHTSDERLPANNQLSLSALGRLTEGIRLHRLHPGSLLILSGYPGLDQLSNAEVMYNTALLLGVSAEDMAIIPEPENTRQEALAYLGHYGSRHPLIMVTTATHIPRAMIWFRKAGLEPIPAPTNHAIKESPVSKPRWWIPSPEKIALTDRAIYEYAGIVQAKFSKQNTDNQ
ncbi:MAG: ElyC/SanA/YdcF family protein [Bacteroidales bacterium]|jgi:uncharacterized SAM-binding protein YcdF (DUF218 family)|nr:ElyC/SanA/YdcF family protein [Bacteroidales bacterium]